MASDVMMREFRRRRSRGPHGLRRGALAAVFAMLVSAWASTASAEAEDEARAHFLLGRSHFDAGQFAKAAAEFEEAYRISQRPALLYNLYVSYRDGGDTKNAARTLRLYLEKEPVIESRAQLEARLAVLEGMVQREGDAKEAAPAPQETEAPAPAPTAVPEQPTQEASPPPDATYEDAPGGTSVVPFVIMGVGGAMVLGSIATGLMASSAQSDLEDMCPTRMNCPASVTDTQSRGETMALVTDVLLFGGIAVAGTGAALWLLGTFDEREPVAAAACGPGGCMASMSMRF